MSTATASSATRVLALDPFACLASSEVLLHLLLKGCYLCCKCLPCSGSVAGLGDGT